MTVFNEGFKTGEFILSEGDENISRDEITIAAAAPAMVAGQVLGKITATGKFVAYNNAATDGSDVAAGILYAAVPDKAVDQRAVAVTRLCEVKVGALTGLDAPGRADLLLLNIVVRG